MGDRKPEWLKVKLSDTGKYNSVKDVLDRYGLDTVCRSANCPNRVHCYSLKTAAFLILGPHCTRHCRFCNIGAGLPAAVREDEPLRLAQAASEMGISYVVVTSVTRDDLPDGGAEQFAGTIRALRDRCPGIKVEVLVPDFAGSKAALETVLAAGPDVLNHNVETVARLYPLVRPEASYERSLELLAAAKDMAPGTRTKTGFMLGLGEKPEEIASLIEDLAKVRVDMATIGQYLPPSSSHCPLARYAEPEEFEAWKRQAEGAGIARVQSGPLVRSSYHAKELSCLE